MHNKLWNILKILIIGLIFRRFLQQKIVMTQEQFDNYQAQIMLEKRRNIAFEAQMQSMYPQVYGRR